jgi:hypothetical protein
VARVNRDRGQLLIITALLLAILFVGLALILNSGIYTENLSTRETTSSLEPFTDDPATEARLIESLAAANYYNETADFEDRRSMVAENVTEWSNRQASQHAKEGQAYATELSASTEGTRLTQNNSGEFMPANEGLLDNVTSLGTTYRIDPLGLRDRTNWLVASDVHHRGFEMTVNRESLKTVDQGNLGDLVDLMDQLLTGSDAFWIELDDGETTWRVYLVEVADQNEVAAITTEVKDEGGLLDCGDEELVGSCRITGDTVTVRLSANELRSSDSTQECDSLSVTNNLGRHDIYYVGADEATGNYSLIVDKSDSELRSDMEDRYDTILNSLFGSLTDTILSLLGIGELTDEDLYYEDPANGSPYTTEAVYSISVERTYVTDRMTYTRNTTIAPAAR